MSPMKCAIEGTGSNKILFASALRCFFFFQVSCHPWPVLYIREPGLWEEVRWAYWMGAGWSAYREGTLMQLIFYTYSFHPWRKTVPLQRLAQTNLEWITFQRNCFFLFFFSVSFQKPVKMRWFVLGKACKHFTHLSDSRGCWTDHRLICYNIPNRKKPVTRKSIVLCKAQAWWRQKSSEDLSRQTPESWCTFSKTLSGMF